MEDIKKFQTASMPLAAYLTVKGHKIVSVSRDANTNKTFFSFNVIDDFLKEKDGYFCGAEIPAKDYWIAIRSIKDIVHGG